MRRILLGLGLVALAAAALWFWLRPEPPGEEAYAGTRNITVWSRLALVREPVATLRYGERIEVLERRGGQARVRTAAGATGWLDERHLIAADLWQRATQLRQQSQSLSVQARGITKVATNVRVEPGRSGPRIYQFPSEVKVEIVARTVAEWTPPASPAPAEKGSGEQETEAETAPQKRQEDWLLVRSLGQDGEVTGWVLGRFLNMDYPAPLRDYAGSIHFVAWFELSRTKDAAGPRPNYVGVGVFGPEGQACDFTLLRVYTWNPKRARYETAYVESNFCGRLPVRVEAQSDPAKESVFRFTAVGKRGDEAREYRMRWNVVRRVREASKRR